VELEEVAPNVRPAERQSDRLIGTLAGQTLEATTSVHLQHAIETHEVFGGGGRFCGPCLYSAPQNG
jgi:hypothetical protein